MKKDLYINLIHKELSGDIAQAEKSQLTQWLKESEDNQLIADHIRQTWTLSGNFTTTVALDMEDDFVQLQKKIATTDQSNPSIAKERPLNSRKTWMSVAAGLLFLAVAGFVINNFLQPKVQIKVANTTAQQTLKVQLADGTKISLNENSTLHYPTAFTKEERRVELQGEAFFEVVKNPNKTFIISTPNSQVKVLGTVFSITDYKNDDFVTVAVKEGKVQLQSKEKTDHLILTANEKGIIMKGENILVEQQNQNLNNMAWHTQKLMYNGQHLKEVLAELNDFYQVQIQLQDAALTTCPFSGTFDHQNIEAVLQTISSVFGMEVEKSGDKSYLLKRGNCE